jgi:protein-S-isoprenylcysteine O-methyltransferase Ste14
MSPNAQKAFALLKTAIFTVVVPGTVAFYVPYLLARRGHDLLAPPQSAWQFLGVLPLAAGVAIYLWCAWDFAVTGLGTPLPIDAPRVLIVKGMYRYVRNPMYVGALNVVLGWAIWFSSGAMLIYLACFWLAASLFVLFYEEPHLRSVFGTQYEGYCRRVNRWLPKLPAK